MCGCRGGYYRFYQVFPVGPAWTHWRPRVGSFPIIAGPRCRPGCTPVCGGGEGGASGRLDVDMPASWTCWWSTAAGAPLPPAPAADWKTLVLAKPCSPHPPLQVLYWDPPPPPRGCRPQPPIPHAGLRMVRRFEFRAKDKKGAQRLPRLQGPTDTPPPPPPIAAVREVQALCPAPHGARPPPPAAGNALYGDRAAVWGSGPPGRSLGCGPH